MLFGARPLVSMGAQQLQSRPRNFPQWSRTAILTIAGGEDDVEEKIKKSPPESGGSGFIIGGSDAAARVAHLEHSVRFLQEQHRQMLSGLHAEIEALRERNRDLQFQLIFNKESSPKATTPQEDSTDSNEEAQLKRDISRLEREAAAARSEARAAEARALQLQRLLDAQTEKVRELEGREGALACGCGAERGAGGGAGEAQAEAEAEAAESRAELRARLADAERLVRRLRADADRQRRELQCMKNSLHASLRASGLDGYGYQNNYHFPPVNTADFWREPIRDEFSSGAGRGRGARRPLALPELAAQSGHRATIYANHHTRSTRTNGYDHKNKKGQTASTEAADAKSSEDQPAQAQAQAQAAASERRPRRTTTRRAPPDHT